MSASCRTTVRASETNLFVSLFTALEGRALCSRHGRQGSYGVGGAEGITGQKPGSGEGGGRECRGAEHRAGEYLLRAGAPAVRWRYHH